MPKFLKIYVRKVHRWLAIPTIVLIPLMIVTNKTPANLQIQKFLQIFMLAFGCHRTLSVDFALVE